MKKDINFADYIVDFFTFFFYQNESIDLFVVVVKENQVQTARPTDRRAHRKASLPIIIDRAGLFNLVGCAQDFRRMWR